MKIKTSITVDKGLLETVDKLSGQHRNRSQFIEAALEAYIAQITRQEQNAKDIEIINRCADDLNKEALDVLDYQVALRSAETFIEFLSRRPETPRSSGSSSW